MRSDVRSVKAGRWCGTRRVARAAVLLLIGMAGPLAPAGDAPAATADGFRELFNGRDLSGWDGDQKYWKVVDGTITGETTAENKTPHNTFLFYKGTGEKPEMPADFELHVKFKLRNHNSGVQYRSRELPEHVATGYQADIAEGNPSKYTGILYEEKGRGILAQRGEKVTIEPEGTQAIVMEGT